MEREQIIQSSIIADMAEGVMVLRFDGVIELTNDAALQILEKREKELVGSSFAHAFFDREENDAFIQSVLDAVYEKRRRMESYVPYLADSGRKQLRVVASCLREQGTMIGVILVISDVTELSEMRDAVKAMTRIQELNHQLELRNRVLQETFGRYLSDDIVKEILESPEGWKLGGQKRTLTILMSDLRGFTALSERMGPQDLITMVNHYFSEMYEEIERYHGTLIEFLGDGMMVIFGAPAESDTHAADAVAAALGMQKRMAAVNAWNAEHGYEELAMGIGINTDTVVLGNIGSLKRTKYGVLGASVNLAGRIESYTTGGQILVSQATCDAVREPLQIADVLSVQPKGADGEIPLFDVVGIGAPYAISLMRTEQELTELSEPVELRFARMEGKHSGRAVLRATVLSLSGTEALLRTENALEPYENVMLEIGGDLYAKVKKAEDGKALVRFTAKPPCFSAWLRSCGIIDEEEGEHQV